MTKEEIAKALEREEPVFFTPIEIERIWTACIKSPVYEMEHINLVENSLYLDHLELNCIKAIRKGVDGAEDNLQKIQGIQALNSRAIEGIAIREFQSVIIRELRMKLLKMESKIREKVNIIEELK
jgi:hypothetical protein